MSQVLRRAVESVVPTFSPLQRSVLGVLLSAPSNAASATELSERLGLSEVIPVNGAMGHFGHKVFDALGRHPDGLTKAKYQWWNVIATGKRSKKRGFVWKLREDVVAALRAAGVEPTRGTDARRDNSATSLQTYLFVTQPSHKPERVRRRDMTWSCSSTTRTGDPILVYITGQGISLEWRATSDAAPDPEWRYTCDVEFVQRFDPPIAIHELRNSIKRRDWSPPHQGFRGVRSIRIPTNVAEQIRGLRITVANPPARSTGSRESESTDDYAKAVSNPIIGKLYSWSEVKENWGGEQTFLAKRDRRIVCATLDPDKNPDAPEVIVVGKKPRNASRANEFTKQQGSIPVFLREDSNRWRYEGRYEFLRSSKAKRELSKYENSASGPLSRVIFLRPADGQDDLRLFPDIDDQISSAPEARKIWVQHFRRERNRGLVAAKKAQVHAQNKKLRCEVCDFSFAEFYHPHASDFCEVHHLKPLSEMEEGGATKLEDLAILCSNCHRVIHLLKPMPTLSRFRGMLSKSK